MKNRLCGYLMPMNAAALRELHQTRPFVPFTLSLADGRKYRVPHNEFLSISKNGRTAVVHYGNDGIVVVDVLMITATDLGSPRRGKKAA